MPIHCVVIRTLLMIFRWSAFQNPPVRASKLRQCLLKRLGLARAPQRPGRILPKDDYADLYAIDFDARKVVPIETRRFKAKAVHDVHFRWGAGLDVGDGGTLSVMATGRNFNIFGFPATEDDANVPPDVEDAELSLGKHCHVVTFDEPLER